MKLTRVLRIGLMVANLAPFLLSAAGASDETTPAFHFPNGYLEEPAEIPDFWLSSVPELNTFLNTRIHRGHVETIGHSAGGRPIHAVFYGEPRRPGGTSTFSGSLGFGDSRAYRGPDHDATVVMIMAAVHGGEFESIVGCINLLSILETGHDLRERQRPDITAAAERIDRIIVIPIMNVDGRARIPIRMLAYSDGGKVVSYLNTGGQKDGSGIGWPQVKAHIPLDFDAVGFPGGYPNDAGVNFQHDDFLGHPQPETRALFDLTGREKPDLILNLHTGVPIKDYFVRLNRQPMEPALEPAWDKFNQAVRTALAEAGLQSTRDADAESAPDRTTRDAYNLCTALNYHCGALSATIESPSHAFPGWRRGTNEVVMHTPEMLLDAQLIIHRSAFEFVAQSGGRAKWVPPRR